MPERVPAPIDFQALLGAIPDPVLVVDASVNLKYVNQAGVDFLGWDPKDWLGRPMFDMIHPDDIPVVISSTGTIQGKRTGTPIEIRVLTADGEWKWVEFVGSDAQTVPGVDGIVVVVRDVTQRRMWEVAGSDEAIFHHLVQHGSSVMLLLDEAGRVSSVNAAFNRLLGHDPSLTVDRTLASFCAPGQEHLLLNALQRSRDLHAPTAVEVEMRHVDPETAPRPLRFEIVNMLDDPVVAGFIVTGHDVSDLHRARRSLEHLARHDALTGLANRSVLLERLEQIVDAHQPAAAVFIDLDRFKPVNDLFGHEAGDELLRQVADRLRMIVRDDDLVARVGGDEFVVLVVGVDDRPTAQAFCDRIDAALAEPYLLAEGPARVTASVGLSLTAGDSTVTGLLADADLAMYESKAERRGEPISRDPLRQRSANERRQLADDLAAGLQRGEVVAQLQPIVSLADGRTVAVEALARWYHPRLGVLGPLAFLALAEDAGLDLLLGDAVLRSACLAVAALPDPIGLGINLSVAQLADRHLHDRVQSILQQTGIPASRLTVEITERDTLSRRAGGGRVAPEHTLMDLHEMGASLALDDFGTGYSSLTHIRRFPLSSLKIDRAFVSGAAEHAEDRAVIGAVVGMAGALGLTVVGEGVERFDQFDVLRDLGCNLAQGFLISPPLTPDRLQHWMANYGDDFRLSITATGDSGGSGHARRTRGA